MERMVLAAGYGLCLFSAGALQDFLKRNKIRKRKLLSLLQKDKELYLTTQREGIWVPLVQINFGDYLIRLAGQDEPFGNEWERKIHYEGFNLEIKDGLWVSAIDQWEPFEAKEYHAETEVSFIEPPYGVEHGFSPWARWSKPPNSEINYTDVKYDVPAGKYLLSIEGYVRRERQAYPTPNCGFFFSLTAVDAFEGYKNPRESDDYDFNIGSME